MTKRSNRLLIVVLGGLGAAVFGVVALAVLLVIAGFVSEMRNPTTSTTTNRPPQTRKVYDRDELRKLIDDKSKDEVLKLLGTPYRTDDTGPNATWVYEEITSDAVTGKIDSHVYVVFEHGHVVRIFF